MIRCTVRIRQSEAPFMRRREWRRRLSRSRHMQIEAVKLAFADGLEYITENDQMSVQTNKLLSEEYAKERRALTGDTALDPYPGKPGIVYLASADEEGNMVSFIQSNYTGFGSGLVVPKNTGVALQNRGYEFKLDPNHLKPGKRTFHTIIPGYITKDGQSVVPFGVMGGYAASRPCSNSHEPHRFSAQSANGP
ncbi:hypothetical protein AB447_220820 [Bacillus glycinifermentans]|uniref:Gamma-glutamyltranspeptidase n=1 Tax=Bacillus glycinifermentans TaxID=1664069 RepID=A0A0T6BMX8_9BACI|nr:hypothetical protein AB447_220820 [Bacillus glycinifermentans]